MCYGIEELDHTADVGLRIRAANLTSLFRDAATGMFAVIHDAPSVPDGAVSPAEQPIHVSIEVEAPAADQLLHAWLTELLFHHTILHSLPLQIDIGSCTPMELRAQVEWSVMDEDTIAEATEVKAVTWHGLLVEENEGIWTAEVIFDT